MVHESGDNFIDDLWVWRQLFLWFIALAPAFLWFIALAPAYFIIYRLGARIIIFKIELDYCLLHLFGFQKLIKTLGENYTLTHLRKGL